MKNKQISNRVTKMGASQFSFWLFAFSKKLKTPHATPPPSFLSFGQKKCNFVVPVEKLRRWGREGVPRVFVFGFLFFPDSHKLNSKALLPLHSPSLLLKLQTLPIVHQEKRFLWKLLTVFHLQFGAVGFSQKLKLFLLSFLLLTLSFTESSQKQQQLRPTRKKGENTEGTT